jgi:hypothetical protein
VPIGVGTPRRLTYQDALANKIAAIREVAKWTIKREAWLAKHVPTTVPQRIALHSSPDPDNAGEALQLLGIALPNPERADIRLCRAQLLLEPWGPQIALRRRRGGNGLTPSERDEIRRSTRDPNSLRWPRGVDT